MRITELSGDSSARDVSFVDGVARLSFEDGETGSEYLISVLTNVVLSRSSGEVDYVFVHIFALCDYLLVHPQSRLFMMPEKFSEQMKAVHQGLHLAVGLHCDKWPLFLQIRGYEVVLACPFRVLKVCELNCKNRYNRTL